MEKFDNYRNLLKKVDEQFAKIYDKHSVNFQCAKSCHSCCRAKLTVSTIEREYIKDYLRNNPNVIEKISELEQLDPYAGERCKFLDINGLCSVYDARPIVCRSHGAPLWFKLHNLNPVEEEDWDDEVDMSRYSQDVCPLNFKDIDLNSLALDDFINIDTLNSILVMVNQLFEKNEHFKSGKRFELSLEGMGILHNKII